MPHAPPAIDGTRFFRDACLCPVLGRHLVMPTPNAARRYAPTNLSELHDCSAPHALGTTPVRRSCIDVGPDSCNLGRRFSNGV